MLIPAVLAGRNLHMADLTKPDRCWLVAGLTISGFTGDDIADRLHCCIRVVRALLADPATILAAYVQAESATFDSEMRLARSEQMRLQAELGRVVGELARVRQRLAKATTPKGGLPRCVRGHQLHRGNTYRHPTGKVYCRECQRERIRDWRAARKTARQPVDA